MPLPRPQIAGLIELLLVELLFLMSFTWIVSVSAMLMPPLPMMNGPRWWRIGRRRQPQRNSGIGPGRALGARRAGKRNTDTNSKDCRNNSLLHRMNSRTPTARPRSPNYAV
jgi:hypothetical protein